MLQKSCTLIQCPTTEIIDKNYIGTLKKKRLINGLFISIMIHQNAPRIHTATIIRLAWHG